MNINEFVSWATLGTYAGCLAMVLVLTQLSKNIPGIKKIPTQLWSWALAVVILEAAPYFTGAWTVEAGALCLLNAAIVSLAANGGYEALERFMERDEV